MKKALLHRDDGKCGIHLGGCGTKLSLRDATIDHIYPRQLLPKDLPRWQAFPYYELQPMCLECNLQKDSRFPLRWMPHSCVCCLWLYVMIVRSEDGSKRLLPVNRNMDIDAQRENNFLRKYRDRIAILRVMLRNGQVKAMICDFPNNLGIVDSRTNECVAECVFIPMQPAGRGPGLGAGGRTSALVTLEAMLETNERMHPSDIAVVGGFVG